MKRRMEKRLAAAVLALLLAVMPAFVWPAEKTYAAKEDGQHYLYFGKQLSAEAKQFYDAMYQMYEDGTLQTGVESLDLVAGGYVTQEQLAAYADGSQELLLSLGAARDAFYADYPEVFYVDFSKLSLRVTTTASGGYQAYLGTGRAEDYFLEGFGSETDVKAAVAEFEEKMKKMTDAAASVSASDGKSREEMVVKYVHDQVTQGTVYRLEDDCTPGNAGHIATVYGALVKGESLCEGYARAVKCVLDRLGIPCVLVQGMYQVSEHQSELHMWNYVQISGEWYGVDATMDDRESGVSDRYLLAGDQIFGIHHNPGGIMSPAGFEFTYPQLSGSGGEYKVLSSDNGLVVEYRDGNEFEVETGIFRVSYNGMGYHKAAEQGKYIVGRTYTRYPGMTEYEVSDWTYMDPKPFAVPEFDDCIVLPLSSSQFVEFAVTELAPAGSLYDTMENMKNWIFHGDPLMFIALSGKVENKNGNYVPAPAAIKRSPVYNARMYAGQKYHIDATFSEPLKESGLADPGITLYVANNTSAVKNSKIENFSWSGDTVSFDFTPSNMFADNYVTYDFQLTGMIGEKTLREPAPFTYFVKMKSAICAYRSQGYYWNMFGRPTVIAGSDLSAAGWVTEDGQPVKDLVEQRIALVATKPGESQSSQMENMIGDKYKDQEILKSETYNIELLYCNKKVMASGGGVRLSVGFPEGYGPEDAGVTYKAYHFITKNGGMTEVEEIDCVVTKYGLVLTCKSFSPFAIVAVKDDGTKRPYERSVILSSTEGGSIAGDQVLTLAEGEEKTVTVKAKDGYVIEQIDMAGESRSVTDQKTMSLQIRYEDLAEGANVLEAKFVAETVLEKEKDRGETAVVPVISGKATVNYPPGPEQNPPAGDGTQGDTPTGGQTGETQGDTPTGGQTGGNTDDVGNTPTPPTVAEQPGGSTPTPPVTGAVQTPVTGTVQTPVAGAVITGDPAQNQTSKNQSNVSQKLSSSGTTIAKKVGEGSPGAKKDTSATAGAGTQQSGLTALLPVSILLQASEIEVISGQTLIIDPQVGASGGTDTYQWYKDGVRLSEQTQKTLSIASVTEADAGSYLLEVTSSAEGVGAKQIRSDACTVTVSAAAFGEVPPDGAADGGTAAGAAAGEHSGRSVLIWITVILGMCGILLSISLFASSRDQEMSIKNAGRERPARKTGRDTPARRKTKRR